MTDGYIPTDWVEIVFRGLTNDEALFEEQSLIESEKPKYNKGSGNHTVKLSQEQAVFARNLRLDGFPYNRIGEIIGCSTMTAHRLINNKTKGYQV